MASRKGSPNLRGLTAQQVFERLGYNPIEDLVKIRNKTDDLTLQSQCAKELAKYFAPQLKATELSGGLDLEHGALSQEICKIVSATQAKKQAKK